MSGVSGLSPPAEEEGGDENVSLGRFENKLSHYLHQHVELLAHRADVSPECICQALASQGVPPREESIRYVKDVVSYAVGFILGRWREPSQDRGIASSHTADVFQELSLVQPGRHRCASGDFSGVFVDDADHPDDIIRRVREYLEVIWKDRADAIEKEVCEILGVADLRDYFRKPGPGGLWDDHVKRYSKSRRMAPIYWLLQSSKKNYALWIYYHRLDKDILFKALLNYVEPKIRLVLGQLSLVRGQVQSTKDQGQRTKDQKKLEKEAERLESLLSELHNFEDKLRRAANLQLEPDLNDGVVLNIAPLHELVPWKEARKYWDELLEGKYEWSAIGKQLRQKGLVK